MPSLVFTRHLPRPPEEVAARLADRRVFETLLPRYLARIRVTYPPGAGAGVPQGTVVEFRPWLFPRRWRVVSRLESEVPGPFRWSWREGPLRGIETWRMDADGAGGTRFRRIIEYHADTPRERLFWALVATPAHALVAYLEGRRLLQWARGHRSAGSRGAPA